MGEGKLKIKGQNFKKSRKIVIKKIYVVVISLLLFQNIIFKFVTH